MKVVALIENSRLESRPELTAEHGLSLYIERGEEKLLFDTGASAAFSRNARRLGIELDTIDAVVVSHHHFDHGGGLAALLQENSKATVYLRGGEVADCYFTAALGIVRRSIGLDEELLHNHAGRFELLSEQTEILPGATVVTETTHGHPRPKGNRRLFVRRGDTHERDDFEHELLLVVEESSRLAVFTGCSHRGILNLLDKVCEQFPERPIEAVFGGFHLIGLPIFNTMAGSPQEVRALGTALLEYPVARYYTGHCTGARAYELLKEVMGDRLENFPTGSETTF